MSKQLDPQLPYIQVARGVAAKAAQLAARCGADYYRVRGVLDCFWEELADRRVLAKALDGPGAVILSAAEVEARLGKPIGASVADLEAAGFVEVRPDGVRVRGMSRYLDAERVRRGRHPSTTPPRGGSKGGPTPLRPPSDSPATPLRGGSEATEVRGERREVRGETVEEEGFRATRGPRPKAVKVEKPPDARHRPTLQALATIFEQERGAPMAIGGREAKDVERLLAAAESCGFKDDAAPVEVVRRWRMALAEEKYPLVATPGELLGNWNHFAGGRRSGEYDPNQGILRGVQ